MKFGLIGDQVEHSFSKKYFEEKFHKLGLPDFSYSLIQIQREEEISDVLRSGYFGLNVTKPYKSAVISYLNQIDPDALAMDSVNTIVQTGRNSWKGFNTDQIGFEQSLLTWIAVDELPEKALILGSGGAAKSVAFVLARLGVESKVVSRSGNGDYTYDNLPENVLATSYLLINTTPLGMMPEMDSYPDIRYGALSTKHWVYDLVYNPTNTVFLTRSQQAGAKVKGGLEMLHLQADYAWSIWKSYGKF